jgi:transcriptional regulator with XRE-family HTH domain
MQPAMDEFRKTLKAARLGKGWTQADVAKRLSDKGIDHIHTTTVAKVEAGERELKLDEALALADLFGLPLDSMLGRGVAPDHDLAFAVLALRDAAGGAMWQFNGIRQGFYPRLRAALAFDFEGRDFVEEQGRRFVSGLTEAEEAVTELALRLPDLTERTEQ